MRNFEKQSAGPSKAKDKSIHEDEIRKQLARIVSCHEFASSDRFGSFLEYLVNEVLDGRAMNIKAYPIGLEVFDRDPDFDPQADPIVRVYAGRLRSKLEAYYSGDGINDPVKIEIPKGTYVPRFFRNDQLGSVRSVAESVTPPIHPAKVNIATFRRPLMIGFSLVTAVILLAFSIYFSRENHHLASDGRMTIIIRQFENFSPEKDNEYLAQRISSEIATELSRFSNVRIIGPMEEVHETELSSGQYLLDGDLYREDENLKVHVTLKDAKSGVNTWSDLYTRNLKSMAMLYIESEIANRITISIADDFGFVQTMLGKQALSKSENQLTAHQALLLYYDYVGNMNADAHQRAFDALQEAVKKSEHHASAWAALSGLYMDKYKHFDGDTSHFNGAVHAIRIATSIDPYNRHVQEHMALVSFSTGQLDDFQSVAEKQLKLYPNATMSGQIGMYMCLTGDYERGLPLIKRVQSNNPYYPGFLHFGPFFYYMEQGDYEKALQEAELVNMPGLIWDPLARTVALAQLGKQQKAREALSELLILKPDFSQVGIETMDRALYLDTHVELMARGLENAGLTMKR